MSLLRRIFGGRSFDEELALGDGLFDDGDFGQAKLAYDRAMDKAPSEDDRAPIQKRIDESLDGIALTQIHTGRQHLKDGDLDLAQAQLLSAVETAASDAIREEAQREIDELERAEALGAAEELEVTDEDRLAAIAGTWEDEQDEEYVGYGDRVTDAILALHAGRVEEGREALEAVLEEADAPRYLWFEVGRARVHAGDDEGGVEALTAFIELMGPDEGGEARLGAHMLLARLRDETGDVEEAIAEYERAAEALEDDPRPLLELGRYLRARDRAADAVEVLELAVESSETEPGWQLLQELGLAYADADQDERAIETLEGVIAFMAARQHFDFPVLTALRLAQLHEKAGKLERAADMFGALSKGSDRGNHFVYHYEAGRVLHALEAEDEALRLVKRASALAGERATALAEHEPEGDEEREALALARTAVAGYRKKIASLLSELTGEPVPEDEDEDEDEDDGGGDDDGGDGDDDGGEDDPGNGDEPEEEPG